MLIRLLSTAAAFAVLAATAIAAEIKPAIVYDLGGKFDKSFNEGVHNGVEQYKKDTGIEYRDFEIQNDSQREQALRNFAKRGHSPIVAVGFSQAQAVEKVAEEFPEIKFAIIDMVVDKPNVASIVFKEHEGSYLVGILAAMASKSGKVGYVGGVKAAKPDAEVFQNMTGTTGAAWNDPVKGGELAKSQFERGADVVYHAAGGTGLGVLQAAADAGKLGIGVDSNQNHIHPGHVLTSMLKRVDVATYKTFEAAKNDSFKPGVQVLGLTEVGVGWALDENNTPLITEEMRAAISKAEEDIKSGAIKVHDYMADSTCPY